MEAESSSVGSSSLFHTMSRMVEDDSNGTIDNNTPLSIGHAKINELVPRITGVITLLSSLCMLWMAWSRRRRLFHRLVLGMSVHLLVQGVFLIYGKAASPLSNSGTIATCTTQGFFIYVTDITALFYYCTFSIYSYVGVLNNFEKQQIIWVEKYIHILVHIYPLCSAFYILSQQGFNDIGFGFCHITASPFGCSFDPSIPCERGPQSHLIILLWYIPQWIMVIFPSIIMVILFVKVRKGQENIFIDATSVAKQAFVYLVPLFWVLIPFLIMYFLRLKSTIDYQRYFIFAQTNYTIFSLWAMLAYLYFSVKKKGTTKTATRNDSNNNNNETDILSENEVITNTVEKKHSSDFIFNSQRIVTQDTRTRLSTEAITATDAVAQQPKYSFNIFDGTNASGAFADFIHDGDSDDEKEDNAATDHWAAVQDHI